MAFKTETLTVLPALSLFLMSSYLAFLTSQFVDSSVQKGLLTIALCLFVGGLVLTVCWGYYWGIYKGLQQNQKRQHIAIKGRRLARPRTRQLEKNLAQEETRKQGK